MKKCLKLRKVPLKQLSKNNKMLPGFVTPMVVGGAAQTDTLPDPSTDTPSVHRTTKG